MHINLAYGQEQVPIDVPDNWINGRCYRPRPLEACADERAELLAAIQNVSEQHDIAKICEGKKSCVIAVDSDSTSLFPEILGELIDQLEEKGGIESSAITVLLTNNCWQVRNVDALLASIPEDIRSHHQVVAHDPSDEENCRSVGETSTGIELCLNTAYCDADVKILLSGVKPDLILGFTGGRTVLAPGLLSAKSVAAMFCQENLTDKNSRYGNVKDNPFHKIGLECAATAGCDLTICAAQTIHGAVSRIFAGHFGQAHLAAMNYILEAMRVNVREPMDIVVTSGGGFPFDNTLASLLTTLSAVQSVLKPDGTIVIAAALGEGLGSEEFGNLVQNGENPREAAIRLAQSNGIDMNAWLAQRLYSILQEHEIIVFNKDTDEDLLWQAGLTPTRDMNDAVLGAMESHGQRCKIVALPEGMMGVSEIGSR